MLIFVASGPTATTSPKTSCPNVNGFGTGTGNSLPPPRSNAPECICTSEWHTPQAIVFIIT